MANIRKSFSFRNGVQVDDDNLIVNSNGLVGIGTSIPTELLDVRGTLKVVGVATVQDAFIGVATITSNLKVGIVSISEDGYVRATSGIITFLGDGSSLSNLPTSQWLDVDVGLGFTSIYAAGSVGVGTTDPRFSFQVGGNAVTTTAGFAKGVGINSVGDVLATGIVTANSFVGSGADLTALDADNISSGTLDNARLYRDISVAGVVTATEGFVGNITGNVTGNVTGNLVGIATTARGLTGTPDITVGDIVADTITANTINVPSTGIVTATKLLHVGSGGTAVSGLEGGRLGIGTALPTSEIQIRKNSGSLLEVISEIGESRISIGQSVGVGRSTAVIRYGSSDHDLDIINNDNEGDMNFLLNGNGSSGSGKFSWQDGSTFTEAMHLYNNGNFSVLGVTTLASAGGITSTGGGLYVAGNLTVDGSISGTITLSDTITSNVNVNSGISTFATINVLSLGIGTNSPVTNFDAKNATGVFANIGIGTTVVGGSKLKVIDGLAEFTSVGVGTTALYLLPGDGNPGNVQIFDTNLSVHGGSLIVDGSSKSSIGFGTFSPRSNIDFGQVGAASSTGFVILPTLTTAQKDLLAYDIEGSILYNSSLNEFQGYNGTSWINLGIQTSNINSNEIKVGTGVTVNSGVVTATNGFTSGIGTAVQITTVGDQLVFTVPGVGSTSFTLF